VLFSNGNAEIFVFVLQSQGWNGSLLYVGVNGLAYLLLLIERDNYTCRY